ncbi:MAG: NADH-quinone oxidoreductase subunit C [Parasporobacterium sp.]|nr:NADH-quinone oxidoreductase subunit C [Parasporobacterium sp.]
MQPYEKRIISKEEVIPVAQEMRAEGVPLAMIHAFIDDNGVPNVSYEYQKDPAIISCTVEGESVLPSISAIYDLAAEWPEREIMELMPITFEGVDTSKRLFMPDSMLDGQGQILVTPMDKLKKITGLGEDKK